MTIQDTILWPLLILGLYVLGRLLYLLSSWRKGLAAVIGGVAVVFLLGFAVMGSPTKSLTGMLLLAFVGMPIIFSVAATVSLVIEATVLIRWAGKSADLFGTDRKKFLLQVAQVLAPALVLALSVIYRVVAQTWFVIPSLG